jgi:hypothetical protein
VWRCLEEARAEVYGLFPRSNRGHHVFFVYGFAKSVRANISDTELKALRRLADELLNYGDVRIDKALGAKELIEVVTDDE